MNRAVLLVRVTSLLLLALPLASVACSSEVEEEPAEEKGGAANGLSAGSCGSQCGKNQCVYYSFCRQPAINAAWHQKGAHNLTPWAEKQAMRNTTTPHVGCVAIMNTNRSYTGHMAYVTAVSGSNVTFDEAGWITPCGTRTLPAASIYGYWCPAGASGGGAAEQPAPVDVPEQPAEAEVPEPPAQPQAGSAVTTGQCVPGGYYCGGDKVTGDPNTLYRCTANDAGTMIRKCSRGCSVNPGRDDTCM